jgi:4'-phosphopantetheinyl transferase
VSDRERFIASRGVLRLILSRYLAVPPGEVRVAYGRHGKPEVLVTSNPHELRFSLSHSGDRALYAVGRGRELGIDLERIREDLDLVGMATRFFAPNEARRLARLPRASCTELFFHMWTRREARLKAKGAGLSAMSRAVEMEMSEKSSFPTRSLRTATGYMAALAVEGTGWQITEIVALPRLVPN